MNVENIVKVMNFHALLRVNAAREKIERAHQYEKELNYVISSIINNRIFKQEKISLDLTVGDKELNIYIGSDLGFCANFNADVMKYLKRDDPKNDKIIIGKKLYCNAENVILTITKEDFVPKFDEVYNKILSGIFKKIYSKVNIIYIHYYNISKQKIIKRTILPFDYGLDDLNKDENRSTKSEEDFVVEGDLEYIIWDLIVTYVSTEIKIAEAWSWASENVQRQVFTNSSLHKIEEKNEIKLRDKRKEKRNKEFKSIIELNNKKPKDEGD